MTVRRLREERGSLSGSPNGWGMSDPAAIPPPGMYSMQRAGVPVTAHTSMQVDVVFTALRVIRNAIIKMGDPRAYRVQVDPVNGPYRVWLNPQPNVLSNTWSSGFQYDGMGRTVISMALFGEAFWLTLARDYLGFPTAIEVLHPAFVDIKHDTTGMPVYWYGSGVNKVKLDPDDLTHIPGMSLPGAARSLNPVEYAGVSFALALAAMEFGQRWFSQGASPSFLLTTETKLGQEEVDRIAERFLIEHSGLQAAHLPLILDSGMKAQKISSTPDEAQFINTLEYARMCISAWFGIPSHLTGGTSDKGNVWGKTVAEQGIQMVDFTFSGYIIPLEQAFSSLLARGQGAAFNERMIQKASGADAAAELMAQRTTAVITPNEYRVGTLHRPPLPGGDVLSAPLASNVSPGAAGDAVSAAGKEDNAGSNGNNGGD
jgi:HK97 family phage portal protein